MLRGGGGGEAYREVSDSGRQCVDFIYVYRFAGPVGLSVFDILAIVSLVFKEYLRNPFRIEPIAFQPRQSLYFLFVCEGKTINSISSKDRLGGGGKRERRGLLTHSMP